MEERHINPLTDFGFKRLFGSEFNKEEMTLYEDSVKVCRDIANAIMQTTGLSAGDIEKLR